MSSSADHPVLAMENYDFLDEDEEEAKMSAPTPAAKRPLKAAKGFAQYTTETKVRTVKVVDEKARRQHAILRPCPVDDQVAAA